MSDRLPWFRCFPTALLGAIAGLQPDEGLTYVTLLLRIYETGGPVAETARTLARRTGLTERRAAAALTALEDMGKVTKATDKRLDCASTHAEIGWQASRKADQSKAGSASAARRFETASKIGLTETEEKTEQNQRSGTTSVERPINHLDLDLKKDLLSEATAPDAPAEEPSAETVEGKAKSRNAYPKAFEDVWSDYPTDKNMSKSETHKAWARLSADDKSALAASLPGFKSWVSAQRDYRTVHFERYIKWRRFEGFAPKAGQINGTPAAQSDDYLARLSDDRWRDALRQWKKTGGQWDLSRHSSPPDSPKTKVPQRFLTEFGIAPRDFQGVHNLLSVRAA